VDTRLHRVQGKTGRVSDLIPLLGEFHHDKLSELLRHQAGARLVGQYDVNNTYQYIINREEMQLAWIAAAIVELGAAVTDDVAEPERRAAGKGPAVSNAIVEEDARAAQAFVDRWRPRVEAMTNARQPDRSARPPEPERRVAGRQRAADKVDRMIPVAK
jgi:hypothetical protein